jgi:peptidoglycan/xylan/chitin deacetylase (PgdA/CDA1 family)
MGAIISFPLYPSLITFLCTNFLVWYWLPKKIFLDNYLEKYYPMILSRKKIKSSSDKKQIALTFDDLPYGYHQELINILNEHNIKATFFIISDYVQTDEDRNILIEAIKSGHQLGNHGKTNSRHASLSIYDLEKEIDDCDELIRSIYREAKIKLPKLMCYRPGYGSFTNDMIKLIRKQNYHLTLGSVYPHDPQIWSGFINYHYIINHIEDGDVIILHDRKHTIPMLQRLLPWLKKNNYESLTLEKMFG